MQHGFLAQIVSLANCTLKMLLLMSAQLGRDVLEAVSRRCM